MPFILKQIPRPHWSFRKYNYPEKFQKESYVDLNIKQGIFSWESAQMRQYIQCNCDNDSIYFQGAESASAGTMESLPPPLTTGSTIWFSSLLGRFCSSLQFCRLNNSHDLLKWQYIGAPQPWVPSLSAESSVVITGNKTSALDRCSQEQHYVLMSVPKKP